MPLEVGLVGLPGAGKTSLFTALTGISDSVYGKEHIGVAPIPDERLEPIAAALGSAKTTPATLQVHDPPGLSPAVLGELRQVDALLAVERNFGSGPNPQADAEEIVLELVAADRDHVERRLERVRTQAKSGDPKLRQEVEDLERVLGHLEGGRPLSSYESAVAPELEPLTTKPVLQVVNGGEDGLDLKLEAELADLDPAEAAEFREGGTTLETVLAGLVELVGLITFFTGNEKETRAWTLRRGQTALDAAAAVHTDLARGFIRCEVVGSSDLIEAGSRAEAARRGVQRLEGRDYVVVDGDVLNIRFNV